MANLNKTQYGLKSLYYALRDPDTGTYGEPKPIPGAISLGIARNESDNGLAADDGEYDKGNSSKTVTGDLNVALFPDQFLVDVLGYIESGGGIGEGEGASKEFALLGQVSGNLGGYRFVWYCCTASDPTSTHQTIAIDGTITYATETSSITSRICDLPNDNRLRAWRCDKGTAQYDDFFEAVYVAPAA